MGTTKPRAHTEATEASPSTGPRGRTRDPDIDARVLAAAARQLANLGYDAMSVAAVADEALTTRQAVYRRWPTKSSLATAALATAVEAPTTRRRTSGAADLLSELIAELGSFQRDVSRPGRMSLVGTMLQDGTDHQVLERYRANVVAPRRQRIRAILERARVEGKVDADADLDIAVAMCTGSWYARALLDDTPPPHWAKRTALLVWRSIGGSDPT